MSEPQGRTQKIRKARIVRAIAISCLMIGMSSISFLAVDTPSESQPTQRAHSLIFDAPTWTGGNASPLASNPDNWDNEWVPDTGECVVFSSGALPCTWNIAKTFSAFYMNASYTGVVTQTIAFGTTGDFVVNSGTFTPDGTNMITVGGNCTLASTITLYALCLEMTGTNKVYHSHSAFYPNELVFSGTITIDCTTMTEVCKQLTVTGIVTLNSGLTIDMPQVWNLPYDALITAGGTITGPSLFVLSSRSNIDITPDLSGTISCGLGLHIWQASGQTANSTIHLSSDLNTTLVSLASDHPDAYMTVDLDNHTLTAIDIIIESNGIVKGNTSTILCSHYFDSILGTFIPGSSTLVVSASTEIDVVSSITLSTGNDKRLNILPNINQLTNITGTNLGDSPTWTTTSTDEVTFTLSGLENGMQYNVLVDGVRIHSLEAIGGTISFDYSGPWSAHQFEIVLSTTHQISVLGALIGLFMALGIIVSVIAVAVTATREKKTLTIKDGVMMAVCVVIGLAVLGVIYTLLP